MIEGTDTLIQSAKLGSQLGIRPEDIVIDKRVGVPATLISTDYLGADTIVTAVIGKQELMIRVPGRYEIQGEETVLLRWQPEAACLFNKESGLLVHDKPGLSVATG